jgi:hypothetical protein
MANAGGGPPPFEWLGLADRVNHRLLEPLADRSVGYLAISISTIGGVKRRQAADHSAPAEDSELSRSWRIWPWSSKFWLALSPKDERTDCR